jgi:hypothetical protein
VTQNCDHLTTGTSRRRVIETTHCIFSRVYEYLDKLDEIGVYDRSLIFVVADHGSWNIPIEMSAAAPPIPANGETHDGLRGSDTGSDPWHGRGVPVFLAKPLGDRHALRISDEPVSLCDVPRSVFDSLAMEHDFGCESVFSVQNPREALRIMYFTYLMSKTKHTWIGLAPKEAGDIFEKLTIVGHSWLQESWVPAAVFSE